MLIVFVESIMFIDNSGQHSHIILVTAVLTLIAPQIHIVAHRKFGSSRNFNIVLEIVE